MTGFAAGQPSLLRAINERAILELIRSRGAISRAQIARATGLSKPTVSLALGGLIGAGLVHEVGRSSGRKGPSAALYELDPSSGWVVGIDVGRHWVRVAVADIAGNVAARSDERTHARSSASLIEQIGRLAHDVAAEAGIRWRDVSHATVGVGGVVDPHRGAFSLAPNLPGLGRQGLIGAIRDELGTGVTFENDVNLAALGELAKGAGRGVANFVFLFVGTGVGMGIVIGGELYRGTSGAAGEIGYMPVGEGDPRDRAVRRRGQLETSASAAAVVRFAQETGVRPPLTAKRVFSLAERGDRKAVAVVRAEAQRIALAVAAVAPVLDPELVILGGGIGGNRVLVDPVEAELRQISPFRPRIEISQLGEEAVLSGALATALSAAQERVFSRAPDPERREIVV